ncbi:MAG TPA: hypothetical protein PLJ60_08945 [Chryseolinea sp.]|nr:hypothetical protein [Chryseolinea sp.]
MAFFDTLLGKKKQIVKAKCPITKEQIDTGYGYLLTTSDVVASKKYWDMVMTEPETISYSVSHFKNLSSGTQMRNMIFEKYSGIETPWMISDSCINLFENIDKQTARDNAKKWWAAEGKFSPDNNGPAEKTLEADQFKNLKDYAVLEAGRSRVVLH